MNRVLKKCAKFQFKKSSINWQRGTARKIFTCQNVLYTLNFQMVTQILTGYAGQLTKPLLKFHNNPHFLEWFSIPLFRIQTYVYYMYLCMETVDIHSTYLVNANPCQTITISFELLNFYATRVTRCTF